MHKNQKSAKRNLLFGFAVSLSVLLVSSGISYFSISQLLDSQQLVEHTSQVKYTLDNLISVMKDAETGQRGYLLTGNDVFLEPYKGSKSKVMDLYMDAQHLTIDNQVQQKDFPQLEKLIQEKYSIIQKTIADKKDGIPPAVSTLIRGKEIMDSIRKMINIMNTREDELMILRNAKMNKFSALTPIFIAFAALLGMLVTVIFYRKIQQNNLVSFRLEQELSGKKKMVEHQIEVVSTVAQKISSGDYSVRIDKKDLQ